MGGFSAGTFRSPGGYASGRDERLMSKIHVRHMLERDAEALHLSFAGQGWAASKPQSLFERYFQEQQEGLRKVYIAQLDEFVTGYCTLLPRARSGPFLGKGIPEIEDLNVLMLFQRQGIGTILLDTAESTARRWAPMVSLAVGLGADYGQAQRLCAKRGYRPDGSGLWSCGHPVPIGSAVTVDDRLVLYLSKSLKRPPVREVAFS